MEGALVGGPVAEEARDDAGDLLHGWLSAAPDRDGDPAADDPVRAEAAGREVGDVHAAALALAVPGLLAEELRHHRVQVHALADALAVAAVGGIDQVLRLQGAAHTPMPVASSPMQKWAVPWTFPRPK